MWLINKLKRTTQSRQIDTPCANVRTRRLHLYAFLRTLEECVAVVSNLVEKSRRAYCQLIVPSQSRRVATFPEIRRARKTGRENLIRLDVDYLLMSGFLSDVRHPVNPICRLVCLPDTFPRYTASRWSNTNRPRRLMIRDEFFPYRIQFSIMYFISFLIYW